MYIEEYLRIEILENFYIYPGGLLYKKGTVLNFEILDNGDVYTYIKSGMNKNKRLYRKDTYFYSFDKLKEKGAVYKYL